MFMKRALTPVAIFCLGASAAFLDTSAIAAENTQVATLNGQPITQEQLFSYARMTVPQANLQDANVRAQIMEGYLNRELFYQEALKLKIDQLVAVKLALEESRHALLAQTYISQLLQERPVTEAMAREVYKKQISNITGVEYQARHILVKTEDEAKSVIVRLKRGEDFARLAQELSIDSTGPRGGALGWITPDKFPTAFAETLTSLKPGKYTTTAVKTDFGWHVVQVDANRPMQPPPFDGLRDQLMKALQDQILAERVRELKKSAKIEFIKR